MPGTQLREFLDQHRRRDAAADDANVAFVDSHELLQRPFNGAGLTVVT